METNKLDKAKLFTIYVTVHDITIENIQLCDVSDVLSAENLD